MGTDVTKRRILSQMLYHDQVENLRLFILDRGLGYGSCHPLSLTEVKKMFKKYFSLKLF